MYRLVWGQGYSWLQILSTAMTPVSQRQHMSLLRGQDSGVGEQGEEAQLLEIHPEGAVKDLHHLSLQKMLHTYCLRLGYPFTNISKETRSYDFLKRDLQGDPQTIQADL